MPTNSSAPFVSPNVQPTLPLALTSFVGREEEIDDSLQLLMSHRLLSLVGPGGCGKTRLALAVAAKAADDFVDGVSWVDLARVSDPVFVPRAIATALSIAEQPDMPLPRTLLEKLATRHLLLILDNCEHVLTTCTELVNLLLNAPSLKVLVTSREPLGIDGEIRYSVPRLALPTQDQPFAELAKCDAIKLFIERARSIRPEFTPTADNAALITAICRHLDGLPLAIELASARVNVLSLRQIEKRLEHRFEVLTSGTSSEARHQTLRSAIDWSYQLLSAPERLLLERLSLFSSGFTLDTIEATCAWGELQPSQMLDLLTSLITKSLVVVETLDTDEARYRLLETIRQYSSEKLLASGAWEETHDHYLESFLAFVEKIAPKLHEQDQQQWLHWLVRELDNLRVALAWAHEKHRYGPGLRLVTALYHFWEARGYIREGFTWFERLLDLPDDPAIGLPLALHVNALTFASFLAMFLYERTASRAWAQKAVALCEASGEEGKPLLGFALTGVASVTGSSGDWQTAIALIERIRELERASGKGSSRTVGMSFYISGMLEASLDHFERAQQDLDEAREMAEAANDHHRLGLVYTALGDVARLEKRFAESLPHYEKSLSHFYQSGSPRNVPKTQRNFAYAWLRQGDTPRAGALFKESLEAQFQRDNRSGILRGLLGFAALAASLGLSEASACLHSFALSNRTTIQGHFDPGDKADALDDEHYVALVQGQLSELELETAREKGRTMRLEEAVTYALSLDDRQAKSRSHDLTRRERDVAGLIGAGLSNSDIAAQLNLSKRTVEKHIANILSKLNFKNRAQIVRWAVERGLSGKPQ